MEVQNELLPVELILRDILVRADDESLRKGLTKGYYISLINQALERLAITSFYQEEPPMDVPMPKDFRWKLPTNFFNISQLYAFNGDCCDVSSSANIYWKRNFNNAPDGKGYTALNKGREQSPNDPYFMDNWGWWNMVGGNSPQTINGQGGHLYANVQNGWLMFSTACQSYSSFRIIYNGFGGVIGDKPLIPRPLRGVVTDMCVLNAFEDLQVRFPKSVYGAMVERAKDKLYNRQYGSWWEAQAFVRQADNWQRNCRELYGSAPLVSS